MTYYYGQHNEDQYLYSLFQMDEIGTCIEIGAYDGQSMSNTYFFEQKGWRCLCIEPIKEEYEKCCMIRKECINCCISEKDKDSEIFHIYYLNNERTTSAISSLKPDPRLEEGLKYITVSIEQRPVKVRSLTSLLDEIKFPKKIDFISIDTENTELDVLKGIDFDKYNIKILVIENNYNDTVCADYLKRFGYFRLIRIAVNDFYIKF